MSKRINIYMSEAKTDVTMKGNITEFDILLGVATLFDFLTPESKELALAKLNNIKNFEVGKLSEE